MNYRFPEQSNVGQILQCMSCVCAGLCDDKISSMKLREDLVYVIDMAQTILLDDKYDKLKEYMV